MIEKKIKKVIKETKEQKEKILIEENLVKTRIFAIVESKEVIDNFEFLPEGKKMKIAKNLISIGLSAEDITKVTGLTMSQIENLMLEK